MKSETNKKKNITHACGTWVEMQNDGKNISHLNKPRSSKCSENMFKYKMIKKVLIVY